MNTETETYDYTCECGWQGDNPNVIRYRDSCNHFYACPVCDGYLKNIEPPVELPDG